MWGQNQALTWAAHSQPCTKVSGSTCWGEGAESKSMVEPLKTAIDPLSGWPLGNLRIQASKRDRFKCQSPQVAICHTHTSQLDTLSPTIPTGITE